MAMSSRASVAKRVAASVARPAVVPSRGFAAARGVNQHFRPEEPKKQFTVPAATAPRDVGPKAIDLAQHEKAEWTPAELKAAAEGHAIMTWGATNKMLPGAIYAARGEGVYFYDIHGKKYLDFNSQAMCTSLGHTAPKEVQEAVAQQMATLPYVYPGTSMAPVRARLSKLLADLCPGDINSFMFPSTGMEANELAVRMARMYTGKRKILSRYRSYHGSSTTTMAMTGDFRSFPAESGATGHVHFFDPFPYSFQWGETDEESSLKNLVYVRELIQMEGPHTIAAIFIETITGTNGILPPPPGYLKGLREICDEFGILLCCDEVMAGFGRSGRLFGFEHGGIIPDIVTSAKGINGAVLPLGFVGMRDFLANHFRENPIGGGSTYNSHPVVLASAYAALKYMVKHDVIKNARDMEKHMIAGHKKLIEKHPSVKQARQIGLFGCFDLQKNSKGDFIAGVADPPTPALLAFKKELLNAGMFTMMRGHNVFTNPPLIIKPKEIEEGFDILDSCLHAMDKAME